MLNFTLLPLWNKEIKSRTLATILVGLNLWAYILLWKFDNYKELYIQIYILLLGYL